MCPAPGRAIGRRLPALRAGRLTGCWSHTPAPRRRELVVPTIVDEGLDESDDLLLTGSRCVEFPADLGKATVDVSSQVDGIFAHRVERTDAGLPQVADLGPDLRHIAVCATGKHARRRRVLLGPADPTGQVADFLFQCGDPLLEFVERHAGSLPPHRTPSACQFDANT